MGNYLKMNKTIEKIIVDVFFDEGTNEPSDKMYTLSDKKMEKIAKLIAQKCMELCDDIKNNTEYYGDEFDSIEIARLAKSKEIKNRIAKQFEIDNLYNQL